MNGCCSAAAGGCCGLSPAAPLQQECAQRGVGGADVFCACMPWHLPFVTLFPGVDGGHMHPSIWRGRPGWTVHATGWLLAAASAGQPLYELIYGYVRKRMAQGIYDDPAFRSELMQRLGADRMQYVQLIDQIIFIEDSLLAGGM